MSESARLAALHACRILDTPAEADFDDFTQLAAQICGTPMAVISLVDERRQWFKSRVGMAAYETPRDVSFCTHGIQGHGVFEIPDATLDERFRNSPLVTDGPQIRFYAGAPLTTPEGHNLGMLCVMDRAPRRLAPEQGEALMRLARNVVVQLELRRIGRVQVEHGQLRERQREMLAEVREVQGQFIHQADTAGAFERLLAVFLRYSGSQYGFIAEVLHSPQGQPYLKEHAITNLAWNAETHRLYAQHQAGGMEFHNLNTLFGHVVATGQPVLSNAPAKDPRRGGLPAGHPPLESFLGMPILLGSDLVGVVGIANRPGGYEETLVEELSPLLSTYGNLIVARRSRLTQQAAEEKLKEHATTLEQRVAERTAALEASQALYRNLIETTSSVAWEMDVATLRFTYISPQIERLSGFPAKAWVDFDFWKARIHPDDRDRAANLCQIETAGGLDHSFEYRLVAVDGSIVWVRDVVSVIKQNSQPVTLRGYLFDVTERVRLQQELNRIKALEQQRIAHELHDGICQDLTAIAFKAKVLAETLATASLPQSQEASAIAKLLNNVVGEAYAMARGLEPAGLMGSNLPVALEDLAIQTRHLHQLECCVYLAGPSPVLSAPVSWHLFRIAREAVQNAVRHGAPRRIEITLTCTADELCLAIGDDGRGFEVRPEGSSGMGLRILQHRAGCIGGVLAVQSQPGAGTQVRCVLGPTVGGGRDFGSLDYYHDEFP